MTEPSQDPVWDPTQYARFADHRSRPFHELVGRIPTPAPRRVVDIGCGPGDLTLGLARRWPDARVVGVDSSPEMLAQARSRDVEGRVEWVESRAEEWDPVLSGDAAVDVIVTNATLQWVPTHLRLIPAWFEALAAGGTFAMQVPANFDAPSHRLMREVAARHRRAAELAPGLDRVRSVALLETYAALLLDLGAEVDAWETTYLQVLPAEEGGEHPVLGWVRSTGLRPVLGALTDEEDRAAFIADYARELEEAYPRRSYGVLFPFTRFFTVAHKRG
ncbi:methyltransferase domain-containing protein [Intrasporangium sp. DVR]|uniref:methyltransferase domain-containing protein n=1 Tax=Intrasporangium sp. DVR TaxID=3127867 RepID=UPI00313A6731